MLLHLSPNDIIHSGNPFLAHTLLAPLVAAAGAGSLLLLKQLLAQLLVHKRALRVVADAVVRVGEPGHLELLWADAVSHQQISESGSVLKVNIVIAGSVLNQEATGNLLEAVRVVHRRLVVSSSVERGCLHVSLGVHGVVEAPVRDGSGGDTQRDDGIANFDHLGREIPAIRPAPDTNLGGIDPRILGQPLGGPDLVLGLKITQVGGDRGTESAALETGATVVNSKSDVLELGIGSNIGVPAKRLHSLVDLLSTGAAIGSQ